VSINISQNNRSKEALEAIQNYLGYGSIYNVRKDLSTYVIRSIKQINNFIELFSKTQILGAKALDYTDFCKGVNILNQKAHLTGEGFAEYKSLIAGMNSTRTVFSKDINPTIKPLQDKNNTTKED